MRICIVAYTFLDSDYRVRRYGEALAERGDHVDMVVLRQGNQPKHQVKNGVHIHRIQKRLLNEQGKLSFLFRLSLFLLKSFLFISKMHLKNRYDLVHTHSVPDFEVFSALVPKLMGAKVILDIHDIVPEFYAAKFNTNEGNFLFKSLLFIERLSIMFSDHIIISNDIWADKLKKRTPIEGKLTTIINYPDPNIFKIFESNEQKQFFILNYPGTLNWHQGVDLVINAISRLKTKIPNIQFHIYGDGPEMKNLTDLVSNLGLEDQVLFKGLLPIEVIAEKMCDADVGIVPKRSDSFGNEAFSTKIIEFFGAGVPVIAARTKVDLFYFNDSLISFFEPGSVDDLCDIIYDVYKNYDIKRNHISNGLKYFNENNWGTKKVIYLNLVNSLFESK